MILCLDGEVVWSNLDHYTFVLLLALLNLAGAVLLGLGLLVTIPLSFCAVTAAYADLFGFQSL